MDLIQLIVPAAATGIGAVFGFHYLEDCRSWWSDRGQPAFARAWRGYNGR